jgi:copper(I)-binding protein
VKAQPAMRRRIGIGFVAVVATLLTSACAAGQKAQTANETPAIDGAGTSVGTIQLRDVAIKSPSSGPAYPAGAAAEVQLVVVNTGTTDDTLVGLSTPAAAASTLFATSSDAQLALSPSPSPSPSTTSTTPSGAPSVNPGLSSLSVPAGRRIPVGISTTDKVLVLTGITKTLYAGTMVQISFSFSKAGTITLAVPVQLTDSASLTPLTIPAGTPTE